MNVSTCSHRPVLTPCSLENFDYQIDPYVGCEHHCHYCYALNQAETDWTKEILIHRDIEGQLSEELADLPPQRIYMGWTTDPYQPCEAEYRQTRRVLELLLDRGFSASILTKSDLITRDIDLLTAMNSASASVSVAFNDEYTRQVLEASTIRTEDRIAALGSLRRAGMSTSALICPVIPYITDVRPLIDMLEPFCDVIWIYGLSIRNASDRNWSNMQPILSRHFPDLWERIEEVAFAGDHSYWAELRQTLEELRTARRLNLNVHV